MWLFTNFGFFSIVQKPGDKQNDTLTVRSRVRSDLAALKQHYLPGLGPIQESLDTDYRFRAIALRAEVSAAMSRMVDGLDYSNFKSEAAKKQGHKRASLYHQVWDVLYKLQTDPAFVEKEPTADSYGGVVVSGGRKVLLREPTKHHGGYAWTFAKTEAKAGEGPRDAAVRAVRDKTGYDAEIRNSVPGVFKGSSTSTCYYVMDAKHPPAKPNWQSAGLRWVNFNEARDLIRQTTNAEGRDRDLAILDAAEKAAGMIAYKEHPNVQPEDWPDLKSMPERHTVLYPKLWFNPDEMVNIRRGFFPTVMEQKWFLYFTGDRLRMHRSWTGILIFDVGFTFDPKGGAYVTDVVVNREDREYGNTDDDEDLKLLEEIIRYHLLQPLEEPEVDGVLKAMALAMQPKYLGSPEVVSSILTPLFATTVSWWRQLHDNSAPRVSPKELQDVETQTVNIFAGENPDYTVMPWHSVEQLGQAAIACFNLNAEYCAGESLFFVIFESIAAVSMAITKLLDGYLQDENAQWGDVNLQLNKLLAFVESVMLGTHTLFNPGKTLWDFQWQPLNIDDEEEEDSEDEYPLDPHVHPCLNDKGETVHIGNPHIPTTPETWGDMNAIATFVPGGKCPPSLNGIPLIPWIDHPETGDDWDYVDGVNDDLVEPGMVMKHGLPAASGVIIEEPDGRVWVASPTNAFGGGYKNTFPKGKDEDEMSWQAYAIKEAYEKAGLQVRIIGLIGDVERSTSVTRYYRAVRVSGTPTDMGWKSQAVHLVPIHRLKEFLPSSYDQSLLKVLNRK